jgi:putative transposase
MKCEKSVKYNRQRRLFIYIKKSRYTDEQIPFALRQAEAGTPVPEIIHKMGICEQAFYRLNNLFRNIFSQQNEKLSNLIDGKTIEQTITNTC